MPLLSQDDLDAIDSALVDVAAAMSDYADTVRERGLSAADAYRILAERISIARRILRETDPQLH